MGDEDLAEINAIRSAYPLPWRTEIVGPIVQMIDASGAVVPLFTMTQMICLVTTRMARKD